VSLALSTLSQLIILNSIAYGVIAGVLCYLLLNGIPFILRKISRDRLLPMDYEVKEWAISPGDIVPIWVYVQESFFLPTN
jgi:AGZA family xanthine/uracil permease-like MFS transporter